MHRSTHIEKLPKLSVAIPGESNAFQVSDIHLYIDNMHNNSFQ